MSATTALHHRGCATTIQKQEDLFAMRQASAHRLQQCTTEQSSITGTQLSTHIYHIHRRQFQTSCNAVRQLEQLLPAGTGHPEGLYVRRSATKNQRASGQSSKLSSHGTRVIPRVRIVLLIGPLMFLIQHDEPQVGKRREQRAPWTDHDIAVSPLDSLPFVCEFTRPQSTVQESDSPWESSQETLNGLSREGDFGHQAYRTTPPPDYVLGGTKVEFRLAAASHSEQEEAGEVVRIQPPL